MSCQNSTAPIDISKSKIKGNCDLKCAFKCTYSDSSLTVINRGDYLSLSYDKSSSMPVFYNSEKYDVQEVRLYWPSIHTFNGINYDAELIVVHTSVMGLDPLLVCVPISANNNLSDVSSIFNSIISEVANNAPSEDEKTVVNVSYNLQNIIPKTPFFTYSGTELYLPCTATNVNYIVYAQTIDMFKRDFEKLKSIVKKHKYSTKEGGNLFYNASGASANDINGDIYIDCQPVGESNETIDVVKSSNNNSFEFNWKELLNMKNMWVLMIYGSITFLVILFTLKYLLNYVDNASR